MKSNHGKCSFATFPSMGVGDSASRCLQDLLSIHWLMILSVVSLSALCLLSLIEGSTAPCEPDSMI